MRWLLLSTVICLSSLPGVAAAAITISEIAWMGTTNSANDEWIEFYNSGSTAVDVSDWRITNASSYSQTGSFDVVLEAAGTIGAGQYAVLERTDDASAPGTAFYIYTGALPNGGATLKLDDAIGNLMDQVAGGENWETIGGDNTTKETAQYTASGWQTATPSPGSVNAVGNAPTQSATAARNVSSNATSGSGAAVSSSASKSSETTNPALRIAAPSRAFVNQLLTFTPAKSDAQWTHKGHDFWWNFGDGSTSDTRTSQHAYTHPGRYVAVLTANKMREKVIARHEITVLPVTLAITRNRAGEVQLSNTAQYEIDVSNYRISAADATIVLPPHTYLLSNQTITIPDTTLHLWGDTIVTVHDAADAVVAYQLPASVPSEAETSAARTSVPVSPMVAVTTPVSAARPLVSEIRTTDSFQFASNQLPGVAAPLAVSATTTVVPDNTATQNVATVIEGVGGASETGRLPLGTLSYLGLIGVLILAIVALYARRIPEE